jgi:hypothetical protein
MKRSLLDMTKTISRNNGHTNLVVKNLTDSTYWIYEATGWRFKDILREIEYRTEQDRIHLYINTQSISARDYIVENGPNGLLVKFIKSRFQYNLDSSDFIEIKGDIEQYA